MTKAVNQGASAEPTTAAAIATARMPGVDVARALAVLGMVLVNYKSKMGAAMEAPDWLVWLSNQIDGRAAALFVVLAGVGISLRSRRARELRQYMMFERVALLKRAAVLFAAGLLNLHMWEWDILHFYGVYLALAALVLFVPGWGLWLLAIACLGVTELQGYVDVSTGADLWSIRGMISSLLFEGMHSVFPWMAFLLMGMWLGRRDLRNSRTRFRVLAIAVVVTVCGLVFNTCVAYAQTLLTLDENSANWLSSLVLPDQPEYMLTATGIATVVICLCVSVTQRRAERRWVTALVATGQLAFTWYIAHALAIVIPQQHGLLMSESLLFSIAYSLAFYFVAIAGSVWWRRRWPYGPLEGLIRQITGRTSPAPWGGERLPRPSGDTAS
jgi:uncharacterized membrane protein YeiB